MTGTHAVAEQIDGIDSSTLALVVLIGRTLNGGTGLGIHQIDVGHAHVRQIGLQRTTPVVHSVVAVALVGNQFLAEVTCAASIGRTGGVACGNHVTTSEHLQILEGTVVAAWCGVEELKSVEHNVVIETRVAVLERMSGIEARLGVGDRQTILHAIGIVDIVGGRHVDDSIVLHQVVHLRAPQLREVPVRAIDIGHRTTHDSLYATRHLPALTRGIENIREIRVRTLVGLMIVNIAVLILSERVRSLATLDVGNGLSQCIGSTAGELGIILIGDTALGSTQLGALLVQRRGSPQQHLAQITQCTNLGDTEVVLAQCSLTHGGVIPVVGQQVGSSTEILSTAQGALLERQARQVERTVGSNHMVDIRHTAKPYNHLLVPPGAHKQQLALDEVLLLLSGIGQFVNVLQSEVHLTDYIPGMLKRVSELVVRGRVQATTATVQETLVVAIPVAVVAQVEVCSDVRVTTTGVHDFVLTPVECAAPEVGLFIGNAVVCLLYETLEVGEVHERHLRIHVRVGLLVQIVGTRHRSQCHRQGCNPHEYILIQ